MTSKTPDKEPMQFASGYQLDLYCDTCYGPLNTTPTTYIGETFGTCAKQARREGWIIRKAKRTARCPKCSS